ncbi:MAG: glutamine synthetase, partial [Solirubrobacteraceae bacterium]|nr:glutamine synthetase [Solirubrobacteraceae bacterium]
EKPFAGVNGSGKHNNWSMGTDTGANLLEPGDTPHENIQFLFFCTAVVQAVNKHQALLRASIANVGQDHRLGANEAPPAIVSIFLGGELEKVFDAISSGTAAVSSDNGFLGLGTPVLPPLPMHGGDRNRTSPFAFTGNKFEFRMLGSSSSLGLPNTVLNTIAAEAIDDLADRLEAKLGEGAAIDEALIAIVKDVYAANKQIVFGGDNYADEWYTEAAERGLENLRSTADALPWFVNEQTVEVMSKYGVLSERELESRYEVAVEQYSTKINIESETAASIARTMLLPAAIRHLNELLASERQGLIDEFAPLVGDFHQAIVALEEANADPGVEGMELAHHMRDVVVPAMTEVRSIADRLERLVADDLWPLPRYSEILFIK